MTHLTAVHTDLSPLPRFPYAARAMAMRDTLCLVWTKDNDIQTKSVGGCRCQCCLIVSWIHRNPLESVILFRDASLWWMDGWMRTLDEVKEEEN